MRGDEWNAIQQASSERSLLRGGDTEAGSRMRRSQLHEALGDIIPGARNKDRGMGMNLEHSRSIEK